MTQPTTIPKPSPETLAPAPKRPAAVAEKLARFMEQMDKELAR